MSIRTERIASQVKRDLGPILQGYQRSSMITITSVKVTDDLMLLKVYLSIYSTESDTEQIFDYVVEKAPQIRAELASLMRNQLRRIPEIHFYLDDTADYVNKIETLFKKIQEQRNPNENQ
jgi:ribosome-binding factor A